MKGISTKDTEQTVQYVQSDQGLFVASAEGKGYENSAGLGLPVRTSEQSRHFIDW